MKGNIFNDYRYPKSEKDVLEIMAKSKNWFGVFSNGIGYSGEDSCVLELESLYDSVSRAYYRQTQSPLKYAKKNILRECEAKLDRIRSLNKITKPHIKYSALIQ